MNPKISGQKLEKGIECILTIENSDKNNSSKSAFEPYKKRDDSESDLNPNRFLFNAQSYCTFKAPIRDELELYLNFLKSMTSDYSLLGSCSSNHNNQNNKIAGEKV